MTGRRGGPGRPGAPRLRWRKPGTGTPAPPRRRWLLATLGLAQFAVASSATAGNVALLAAQSGLGFSAGERRWAVSAYALAFGILLLPAGWLPGVSGRGR